MVLESSYLSHWLGIPQITMATKVIIVMNGNQGSVGSPYPLTSTRKTHVCHRVKRVALSDWNRNWNISTNF
jgi:hypothetical protein